MREQSDSTSEFGSIYARELARKGNYTSMQIKASLVMPVSVSAVVVFFTSFRQPLRVKAQLSSREHLVDVPDRQKVGPPRSMAQTFKERAMLYCSPSFLRGMRLCRFNKRKEDRETDRNMCRRLTIKCGMSKAAKSQTHSPVEESPW